MLSFPAVPGEYFCALDASGRRYDTNQRPELSKGTVEFVAPTEYMVRPPMPPSYFFLIDVSVSAVRSGLLEVWFCLFLYFFYITEYHLLLPLTTHNITVLYALFLGCCKDNQIMP